MSLELRQLRYFVAVAEELHFGRAAARLQIAQPGLSQQIKRLERQLGVQLLVRDKLHVEMTPSGEVLLEHARMALDVVNKAVESTRAAGQGKTALLRVGAYALGIFPMATKLLEYFGERFPQVAIEFHPAHTKISLDALTRRRLDLAIVFSPFERPPRLGYLPLGTLEGFVVVPVGHRLAELDRIPRRELLQETVFTWPRDLNPPLVDHMRAVFFGEAQHERLVEIADGTEALVRVAAGKGITMTNPMVADGLDIRTVVIRRIEDPAPEFEYGLTWLESNETPYVHDFVAVARELTTADIDTAQNPQD